MWTYKSCHWWLHLKLKKKKKPKHWNSLKPSCLKSHELATKLGEGSNVFTGWLHHLATLYNTIASFQVEKWRLANFGSLCFIIKCISWESYSSRFKCSWWRTGNQGTQLDPSPCLWLIEACRVNKHVTVLCLREGTQRLFTGPEVINPVIHKQTMPFGF